MSKRKRKLKQVSCSQSSNEQYRPCNFPEQYPTHDLFTDKEWKETLRLIAILKRKVFN